MWYIFGIRTGLGSLGTGKEIFVSLSSWYNPVTFFFSFFKKWNVNIKNISSKHYVLVVFVYNETRVTHARPSSYHRISILIKIRLSTKMSFFINLDDHNVWFSSYLRICCTYSHIYIRSVLLHLANHSNSHPSLTAHTLPFKYIYIKLT